MTKNYEKYLRKKKCVIFLFHGVYRKEKFNVINYTNKHISERKFIKILKKLSIKGKCISIDEAYNRIKFKKKFDDYSFVITFDDGFYNNFSVALPILKNFNFPAVFYLTYNFINYGLSSWTDQIEYIVEKSGGGKFKTTLGKFEFSETKKSKINFLKKIRKILKGSRKVEPYKFIDKIADELKFKKNYRKLNFSIFKKMNWGNVIRMSKNKLFTIGGHSKNHDILSRLSDKKIKNDISFTIRAINKKLKKKIKHFSYPEGTKGTYSQREIKILRKEGIKICPSANFGFNDNRSNLFHLKRINVN